MRVLHFTHSYLPVTGGTTTRILNTIASASDEHVLYVPRPVDLPGGVDPASVPADEVFGHVTVHRIDLEGDTGLWGRVPWFGYQRRARRLADLADGEKPDLLHGHYPVAYALAAVEFKRRHGTPLVYEAHGIMRDFANFPGWRNPVGLACRAAMPVVRSCLAGGERKLLGAADHIIVQTESCRARLEELYGLDRKPVTVVRNGVDAEAFDPGAFSAARDAIRQERGWGDHVVCLYAGYLDRINGVEFLLDALPSLSEDARRRLKIVLAGRGPQEQRIRRAAQEWPELVDFLGSVRHDEMGGVYAASDVFLIPRPPHPPAEAFLPMKLLEAMAMERVLVVSDVAAMAEVVSDGRNGLLFPKGDRAAFAAKLEAVASDIEGLREFGVQARRDVVSDYSWAASRARVREVYESLA
jgi:glycosyltransferase involved in cell wall biosynthesis